MNPTDMPSRFGFHSLPFTREIRVADRFAHELYERPRDYLLRAVDKRMSGALIAPAGTGKTTLLLLRCYPSGRDLGVPGACSVTC
jgi:ATP/maltotriose-dependent transcriptional regulator MalT